MIAPEPGRTAALKGCATSASDLHQVPAGDHLSLEVLPDSRNPVLFGRRSLAFSRNVVAEDEGFYLRCSRYSSNISSIRVAGEDMADDFGRLGCAGALPERPRRDLVNQDVSSLRELYDILRVPRITRDDNGAIGSIETISERMPDRRMVVERGSHTHAIVLEYIAASGDFVRTNERRQGASPLVGHAQFDIVAIR